MWKTFLLERMWLQALLSNLVTLTQVCPRTFFADTALLCLGCWFLVVPYQQPFTLIYADASFEAGQYAWEIFAAPPRFKVGLDAVQE